MRHFLIFLIITLPGLKAYSQESLRKRHFNLESSRIGVGRYDPVSYHSHKAPTEGEMEWAYEYKGIKYFFASEDNLDQFKLTPEHFEPQFGGWCAYAMAETGEKVQVDPETFKIIEGKLYLFYNFYFTNTLKKWNKDEERLKSSAKENWSLVFR